MAREAAEAAKKKQDKDENGNTNEEKPDKNITIQGIRNAIDKNRKEEIREEEKKNIKKKEGNTDFSSLSDIFYDLMGKDTE